MPEPLSSSPQRTVTHPTREARGGAEGRRTTMDPVTVSIINIADAERIALPANVYLFNYKANGAVANNKNRSNNHTDQPSGQQQLTENVKKEGLVNGTS